MQQKQIDLNGRGNVTVNCDMDGTENAVIRIVQCSDGSVIVHSIDFINKVWVPLRPFSRT